MTQENKMPEVITLTERTDADKISYWQDKWTKQFAKHEELKAIAEKMVVALEMIEKACVCKRSTKGFDYGEKHPNLGICEAGARWNTPRVIASNILNEYNKYKGMIK